MRTECSTAVWQTPKTLFTWTAKQTVDGLISVTDFSLRFQLLHSEGCSCDTGVLVWQFLIDELFNHQISSTLYCFKLCIFSVLSWINIETFFQSKWNDFLPCPQSFYGSGYLTLLQSWSLLLQAHTKDPSWKFLHDPLMTWLIQLFTWTCLFFFFLRLP